MYKFKFRYTKSESTRNDQLRPDRFCFMVTGSLYRKNH